ALAGTGLDPQQRRAVTAMLTTDRFFSCLVAAAGTGKTHVMAAFSKAWAQLGGGRVICLTLSENAARVAAAEGFTEAWNIARFFASKVPARAGDVLVIDEASQVSTQDLARICSLALQVGVRVIGVGRTRQLPAGEAGGVARLGRDRRIERGQIGAKPEGTLGDGSPAGPGDLVRARLNTSIDAGGQRLTNRDTLRLTAFRGAGKDRFAIAERQTGPG